MDKNLLIRAATQFDFVYLADHLRAVDKMEIELLHDCDASVLIRNGHDKMTEAYTLEVDGLPVVLFGVFTGNGMAEPWLIATDSMGDIPASIVMQYSKSVVSGWHERYGFMANLVHAENEASIRWLEWCGFSVGVEPTGPEGKYRSFWLGRPRDVGIRVCCVDDIVRSPSLEALLSQYGDESSIPGIGTVKPDFEAYRALESTGAFHVIGAFCCEKLVGFCTLLVYDNPHYSCKLAVTESLFVANQYRDGGVGTRIIQAAEELGRDLGACGVLVSAPKDGRLDKILPRKGYAETNHIFFKAY